MRFLKLCAFVPLWFSILLLPACSHFGKPKGPPMETGYSVRTYQSPTFSRLRSYAIWVPKDYNRKKQDWPLMVFLHGYGECGDMPDLLIKHGPIKEAVMRDNSDFIIIAPQSPKVQVAQARTAWLDIDKDVMLIMDEVERDFRVDKSRVYLTGISMGGFGTFALAAEHPGMFAAVAPICGGGEPAKAPKYGKTPFWIFHGEKDHVVPVITSKVMEAAIKDAGGNVKLTLYPEADHDSWSETYSRDDLYAWFLNCKLNTRK